MKKSILKLTTLLILLSCVRPSYAQVKWYTIEEAEKKAAETGKKIMVKVYTNWCGWCKEMDKSTFPNEYVTTILNESFIPVKFNAEQKTPVTWGNTSYKLVKTKNGSYHQLAAKWLEGKMSYPTIVFLDAQGNRIQSVTGYRKALQFEKIASYFATESYKITDWLAYEKSYERGKK